MTQKVKSEALASQPEEECFAFYQPIALYSKPMSTRFRQTSQKVLLLAAVASVVGHLLMLSLAGLIIPGAGPAASTALVVELRESPEGPPDDELQSPRLQPAQSAGTQRDREETVDLGNRDSRYMPYLMKTKKKIDSLWAFPAQAHEPQPGVVVVRFTINRNGILHESGIEVSSGVAALDYSALSVIRAAAPFHPFTDDMKFSRLHIIATFKYRVED